MTYLEIICFINLFFNLAFVCILEDRKEKAEKKKKKHYSKHRKLYNVDLSEDEAWTMKKVI